MILNFDPQSIEDRQSYFIPNYHKNAVGLWNLRDLVQDDFTINVRVKPDWEKCGGNHYDSYGIFSINGMDLGVFCRKDQEGNYVINAEFWVNRRNPEVKFAQITSEQFDVEDWLDISFIFQKNKSVTLVCNGVKNVTYFTEDLVDYTDAWLWLGCANNRWNVDGVLWRNFKGQITDFAIFGKAFKDREIKFYFKDTQALNSDDFKPFFIMSSKNKTHYKIFDESGNGNHLCKTIYNSDGRNLLF